MKKLTKNKIVIDTGPLLEYFKLVVDSYHKKLTSENKNRLVQFLELFKGRKLIIVPQVLSEIYSLLKREAKGNDSKIQNWLKILHNPHIKNLIENYIQKETIVEDKKYLEFGFTDIALMKSMDDSNILLTKDYPLTRFCRYKGLDAYHLEEIFL